MRKFFILFFSFGVTSLILVIFSSFWGCFSISTILGMISTIISIVLSVVAMIYTCISGKSTLDLLDEIKKQNEALAKKIVQDAVAQGLGQKSIEVARDYLKSKHTTDSQ
jgi:uncharacterized membrane protein